MKVVKLGVTSGFCIDSQLFKEAINDLRSKTKPRSHQTDILVTQLAEEGIEIVNSHLNRQTVVVWILCHSKRALETVVTLSLVAQEIVVNEKAK